MFGVDNPVGARWLERGAVVATAGEVFGVADIWHPASARTDRRAAIGTTTGIGLPARLRPCYLS
jgi:hypothetical protein